MWKKMEKAGRRYASSALSFKKDEIILSEGDKAECAYLVQAGRVRVYITEQGKDIEIARLGTGQIFGEMALIEHYRHMATIQAVAPTILIPISAGTIDKKLAETDPLIKTILHALIDRLYTTTLSKK
jgi:CRP-like cAMP-binding protein